MYGINTLGRNCRILENVTLGYPSGRILSEIFAAGKRPEDSPHQGVWIGDNAIVRPGTTIYCEVIIGNGFRTGHNALIRESTVIGDGTLVGTNAVVDGGCRIGSHVSVQSNAYIPTNTVLEDHVFLGPCCVLANDKYPVRVPYELRGPVVRKGASIGANATLLPGVEIGEGAMVAAGALVTRDVPPWKLALGCPAKIVELPESLKTLNRI
ncbi:MAG TPA: DapH/DapD/GlmU-related protein [Methanocella sp.]|nr:DapH/DapD/GlmU-related protein [Methanocella sp.]